MSRQAKLWLCLPVAGALGLGLYALGDRTASPPPRPQLQARVEQAPRAMAVPGLTRPVVFEPRSAPPKAPAEVVPTPDAQPEPRDSPEIEKRMAASRVYVSEPADAAQEERDAKVLALAASGEGGSQYRARVEEIERAWLALDQSAGIGVDLSTWDCYRGGCTVKVTLPSAEAHQRFSALVQQSSAMALWKGGGFRSGPVRTDSGEVEVTWVFYAHSGGA